MTNAGEDDLVEYTKESRILAIVPKVPAFLSILGSGYIVYNVLFIQRRKKNGPNGNGGGERNKVYHHLMAALSISDMLSSHIYFLGTFLIPRGSGGPYGPVYWAFGTDGTCSYSGFFNQFAVASPIYNTMLSIYFLLKLRYGWRDVQLNKIGPMLHALPIVFACGTAFFALFRQPDTLYGNVFWTCWINPDPPQPDFRYFQWLFLFAPVWVCVIFQTLAMVFLYLSVRNVEQETKAIEASTAFKISQSQKKGGDLDHENDIDERPSPRISIRKTITAVAAEEEDTSWTQDYSEGLDHDDKHDSGLTSITSTRHDDDHDHTENNDIEEPQQQEQAEEDASAILAARSKKQRHSKMIAIQGILYVAAFYITWLFPTIQRIMELAGVESKFWIQALDTSLLPLQGLFNVIIYLRPKYVFYRRKYPDLPRAGVLRMVHNRENEETVVHHYTTRLNERLTRLNQSEAVNPHNPDPSSSSGREDNNSSRKNRSFENLPPIREVSGEINSMMMHSSQVHNNSEEREYEDEDNLHSSREAMFGSSNSFKWNNKTNRNSSQEFDTTPKPPRRQSPPTSNRSALMNWLQDEAQQQQAYQQSNQAAAAAAPSSGVRMDGSIFQSNYWE